VAPTPRPHAHQHVPSHLKNCAGTTEALCWLKKHPTHHHHHHYQQRQPLIPCGIYGTNIFELRQLTRITVAVVILVVCR
jgi:hypothetical protein